MEIKIIVALILSSLLFSIGDICQNKSVPISGPAGTFIITEFLIILFCLILMIILYFNKNKLGPLFLPNKKEILKSLKFCFLNSFTIFVSIILINLSFFYNSHLKNPVNLGVLTGILSTSFIFTILLNVLVNLYEKKPINIPNIEIIGCVLILAGVLCICSSTKK